MTDCWVVGSARRSGERVRWRFGPLEAKASQWLVGVLGRRPLDRELAQALGVWPRQVYRWREAGVPEGTADRLAVGMGWHPFEVWPEWLDYDSEEAA